MASQYDKKNLMITQPEETLVWTLYDTPLHILHLPETPSNKVWDRYSTDTAPTSPTLFPWAGTLTVTTQETDNKSGGSIRTRTQVVDLRLHMTFYYRRTGNTIVLQHYSSGKSSGGPHLTMNFGPNRNRQDHRFNVFLDGTVVAHDTLAGRPYYDPPPRLVQVLKRQVQSCMDRLVRHWKHQMGYHVRYVSEF